MPWYADVPVQYAPLGNNDMVVVVVAGATTTA